MAANPDETTKLMERLASLRARRLKCLEEGHEFVFHKGRFLSPTGWEAIEFVEKDCDSE